MTARVLANPPLAIGTLILGCVLALTLLAPLCSALISTAAIS